MMSRISFAALLVACMVGAVMAGPCIFTDGDCKPNPTALPGAPKGAAT